MPRTRLALLTAIVFLNPLLLPAHDVPNDVTIHTFLKPDGDRLRLLVRVPMKAISDVTFPEQGKGFLDLEKVVVLLPDAARLWISDNVDLYEDAVRLPKPRIAAARVSLALLPR